MAGLVEAIEIQLREPVDRVLADSIFGEGIRPEAIAARIHTLFRTHLEVEVEACGFIEQSVGAVFGLLLTDGRTAGCAQGLSTLRGGPPHSRCSSTARKFS